MRREWKNSSSARTAEVPARLTGSRYPAQAGTEPARPVTRGPGSHQGPDRVAQQPRLLGDGLPVGLVDLDRAAQLRRLVHERRPLVAVEPERHTELGHAVDALGHR